IPAMLLAGIPPLQVLGTNKLQAVFGSGAASWSYARAGHVDLRGQWPMALGAALGAVGGALLATAMPTDWLRAVLPLLLVAIALYFGVKRDVGELERHRRISPLLFGLLFVPAIGFYDGVFGPGTGSFLLLGFVSLAGFGAVLVFVAAVEVLWKVGLVVGVGQWVGARLGSRFAMRQGARVIRPLLVVVSIALALRLLADPTHPVRQWIGG